MRSDPYSNTRYADTCLHSARTPTCRPSKVELKPLDVFQQENLVDNNKVSNAQQGHGTVLWWPRAAAAAVVAAAAAPRRTKKCDFAMAKQGGESGENRQRQQ